MERLFLALDIGGTKCAASVARVGGGIRILQKEKIATPHTGIEEALTSLIDRVLHASGCENREITACGISCGGPLDAGRGVILCPPNLPGWENLEIAALIRERYGFPAYLQNDANACALAEWKLGAGRGARDMVFLTMGTGMGAGVITGGRLLRGASDMGGEIGHIRLRGDGPLGYGKAGSFEGFCSGGGIARQAAALTLSMLEAGKTPAWIRDGHSAEEADAKLLAEYARRGDRDALAFFDSVGGMLGEALAVIADILNPECVVIGSVFARCEDLLRPAAERALKREALPFAADALRVVPAGCGENVGDLAAVMAALYELDIDPMEDPEERDPAVLAHYERLFARYPALSGIRGAVTDAYLLLRSCYERGGKVMTFGNGGSCADGQHIVGELMKGFYKKRPLSPGLAARIGAPAQKLQGALPAVSLNDSASLASAFRNDCDPLLDGAQQVLGLGKKGDVFLAISTSGNSKNVCLAAETAKAVGCGVIALTGGDGGALGRIADAAIVVPGCTPADVQELHLPVYHTLCAMLEEKFFGPEL